MRKSYSAWIVFALVLGLLNGCATPPTMKRIKGYTEYPKENGQTTAEKIEPQPRYYAVLPFALLYDAVTAPFLFLYATLGVNTGLIKP